MCAPAVLFTRRLDSSLARFREWVLHAYDGGDEGAAGKVGDEKGAERFGDGFLLGFTGAVMWDAAPPLAVTRKSWDGERGEGGGSRERPPPNTNPTPAVGTEVELTPSLLRGALDLPPCFARLSKAEPLLWPPYAVTKSDLRAAGEGSWGAPLVIF